MTTTDAGAWVYFKLTFEPLAKAQVSLKSTFSTFSYKTAKVTKFDLTVK